MGRLIKLFIQLRVSDLFTFYQNPNKKLIKLDGSHYVHPMGVKKIDPHVAIFTEETSDGRSSIFTDEGDTHER